MGIIKKNIISNFAGTMWSAIMGLIFIPLYIKFMGLESWGIVGFFVCLQLVMKVPVWFVIERASALIGGTGWHRAMLIDNFIRHFFEWCLIGTRDNVNWGWSMWDVDNAYVGVGLSGGLVAFILFLCVFVYGYRTLGIARSSAEESGRDARLIWGLGASLFANTVGFFGIVYFDQSIIVWYALLAMIQVTATFVASEECQQPQAAPAGTDTYRSFAEPA